MSGSYFFTAALIIVPGEEARYYYSYGRYFPVLTVDRAIVLAPLDQFHRDYLHHSHSYFISHMYVHMYMYLQVIR